MVDDHILNNDKYRYHYEVYVDDIPIYRGTHSKLRSCKHYLFPQHITPAKYPNKVCILTVMLSYTAN